MSTLAAVELFLGSSITAALCNTTESWLSLYLQRPLESAFDCSRRRQRGNTQRKETFTRRGLGGGGEVGRSSHKNLHSMVVAVGHDDAAVAVDGDAAAGVDELPVA